MLLTLNEGYLLTAALPDLQRGMAPLGPPVPVQPPLLGHGVVPPDCCPWSRHRVGPPGRRPDLRWEVAPLGRSCAVAAWHSWPLPLTSDAG